MLIGWVFNMKSRLGMDAYMFSCCYSTCVPADLFALRGDLFQKLDSYEHFRLIITCMHSVENIGICTVRIEVCYLHAK